MKCSKCHTDNPDTQRYCGECGTQLSLDKDLPSITKTLKIPIHDLTRGSTFLNRYEIIEELGEGGMGKVYRVFDKKLNEEVALKLIKSEIASDLKTLERFSNELRIARKIVHKNVGSMYELMEEDGTHFITLEFVSGQDLKGLIKQSGQLAVGTTVKIVKQLCSGLSEAHKLGVVHRDLKPGNIMIDKEGDVRIMDFGIARSLKEKRITGAGVIIGTPEYMSPEQAETKEIDHRSDIYSLGVILYEMVTGQLPFEGETALSLARKHADEIPRDPKEINPQIPDDLNGVIMKCLEKNRDMRYQSAGELYSELDNIEKGIPTTDRVTPKRKSRTSKEITVTFGIKRLFIPALAAVVLAIIAIGIWQLLPKKEVVPSEPVKPSIAVLPFEDLSPDKDQEYFCDGLADELINRLTKIKSLRVPARTSAFSFKGKGLDIQEIGTKLNVDTILEGSLRKSGPRLRITVQLVNVEDGYPLWSEKYERDEEEIFVLQDDISLAIVDNLKVKLLGEDKENILKRYTENPEAYNLYLLGRHFWNRRTEESLNKAIEYFEKAIEIDPNYALAYVGLADSYIVLPAHGSFPPKDAYSRSKEAAFKALEIDDSLAEAHTSLAGLKSDAELDREGAEREFKRAIELKPNYATAHQWYAELLSNMGRDQEAISEITKALELDPLSLVMNSVVGMIFYFAGQSDQAIIQCQKVINMDPNFTLGHRILGFAYLQKGMHEEAIVEFRKLINLSSDNPMYIAWLGYAYAVSGKIDEVHRILEKLKQLSKQKYVPSFEIAMIHTGLDDKDQAFEWLEKAHEERSEFMNHLKVDPVFDRLHSDPRFNVLLQKLGF